MVRSDLKWQHLPILFLSNDSDAEQIDRAFQAGADDYFHKSNSASELVERILRRLKRAGQYPSQPFSQNSSQNSISNATQASLSRPCNKQDAPA
jgi:DNA-binding response OmpR family regulator